ncbi:MAG TPA: glycosyltransferase family 61 protein [Pyrinomonadaceae bacterium]|nr:glycosyltransferase family 61 protein [Pyrinomonadaceae bacterium]
MKSIAKDHSIVEAPVRNQPLLLYPQSIARRKLPVNLNSDHLPLFSEELERTIPPTSLLEFQDVRISPDGFLFKGKRILPESFAFPFQLKEWKLRSLVKFFANNYLLRRTRVLDVNVLWITDHWSKGYFHWFADALPRLFVVRDKLDELVLMLPWDYQTRDFVTSSLKAFAVKNVGFIDRGEVLKCQRLFLPTHTAPSGSFNENIIRSVQNILKTAYADSSYNGPGERIYISRGRAPKRKIVNEEEVVERLSAFGFRTIYAEEHSFEEQVRICSRARYLVSNHGAGLTNMLFMNEGGSVLELRHQEERITNCYFSLSSALNLNYFYQTCEPEKPDVRTHSADLLVDPVKLEKNLRLLVA